MTVAELSSLAFALTGILIAIRGRKKEVAETMKAGAEEDKARAEAGEAYANQINSLLSANKVMQERQDALERKLESIVAEKDEQIHSLESKVEVLQALNERKDIRISELETISHTQATRIAELVSQMDELTRKNVSAG